MSKKPFVCCSVTLVSTAAACIFRMCCLFLWLFTVYQLWQMLQIDCFGKKRGSTPLHYVKTMIQEHYFSSSLMTTTSTSNWLVDKFNFINLFSDLTTMKADDLHLASYHTPSFLWIFFMLYCTFTNQICTEKINSKKLNLKNPIHNAFLLLCLCFSSIAVFQ